jgi:formylglycine-generating enzyme required for sulfatase activity/serine/threonine protein kinase
MPEASDSHPGPEELADFGAGKLARDRAARVAAHVGACAECRQKLDELSPDSFVGKLRGAAARGGTLPAVAHEAPIKSPPQGATVSEAAPAELASSRKFEVLGKLGDGGMGSVWKVRHTFLNRVVAIKVMRPDALARDDARDRFLQEMRAVGTLQHPRIVRALDAEKAGELLLLVMECVDGRSLQKLVTQKGPLPVGFACRFALQAAEGLQHAFEKGMVHRDIKPANLMVTRDTKEVKILDFGLARVPKEQKGTRVETRYQTFMGTPEYVAPEQANDARGADIRSDIYSLGCTLYFLLSGKPPFEGETAYAVVISHMQQRPRPLPELRPDVSAEVWAVVAKMMAKAPRDRYQTPAEVVRALEPFALTGKKVDDTGEVPAAAEADAGGSSTPLPSPERGLPPPLPQLPTLAKRPAGASRVVEGMRRLWPRWRPFVRAALIGVLLEALILVLTVRLTMFFTMPPADPVEEWPRELTNSIGMKLVRIPAGRFSMGSLPDEANRDQDEGPRHEVEITRPFYLGAFEVTQSEYEAVMGKNPSWFSPVGGGRDLVQGRDTTRFPVEMVSWEDAAGFCTELSARPKEKRAGRKYRLPTEAEWEYACRGGAPAYSVFHLGDSLGAAQANFDASRPYGGGQNGEESKQTCRVGLYPANRFGLYDLHGNVREWCSDWYDHRYYEYSAKKDPECPKNTGRRVLRGGSWRATGVQCRAAYRGSEGSNFPGGGPGMPGGGPGGPPGAAATGRDNATGFRVVCVAATRGE